jgi:hypothetical protein
VFFTYLFFKALLKHAFSQSKNHYTLTTTATSLKTFDFGGFLLYQNEPNIKAIVATIIKTAGIPKANG